MQLLRTCCSSHTFSKVEKQVLAFAQPCEVHCDLREVRIACIEPLPTTLHSHEVLRHTLAQFCSIQNQFIQSAGALSHSLWEAEESSHYRAHFWDVQPAFCILIFIPLNSAMPLCPTVNSTWPSSKPSSCNHLTVFCRIPSVFVLHKSISTVLLFIAPY